MSYLELWATYCVKQRIPFDDFAHGAEILMSDQEDIRGGMPRPH